MGTLANREDEPQEGEKVEGIMVTNSFSSKIVSPDDLATYTPLRLGSISSKLHVPFCGAATTLELFLNEMYHGVKKYETEGIEGSITNFELQGGKVNILSPFLKAKMFAILIRSRCFFQVSVTIGQSAGVAIVEWEASPAGDVIADSVVALLLHAQSSSASIRLTSKPCRHPRENNSDEPNEKKVKSEEISSEENLIESRLRLFHSILKEQYSNVEATLEGTKATYEIQGDGEDILCIVKVDFVDEMNAQVSVESEDEELGLRVQDCLRNTATAAAPIRV